MAYCTQAECLYLPIWEKVPFGLELQGEGERVNKNVFSNFGIELLEIITIVP